jgi:hypothetical protein
MWKQSLKCDASATYVPTCESIRSKIFILSLTVNDFNLPLLSIFHPRAVKFVSIDNSILSQRSDVTQALED